MSFLLCDVILITIELILKLLHYHRLIDSNSLLEIAYIELMVLFWFIS